MDKRSVLVVSLLSLLLLFSFRGYAEINVTNSWELPADPATYSPGIIYRFNATVCNSGGYTNIDKVLFEWNGVSNIVTENFNIDQNCSVFSTTKIDLPANETGWSYKWYANNTVGESATPLIDSYTITKGYTSSYYNLYIDNATADKITSYPTAAEIRGNSSIAGASDLIFSLYRNNVLIGSANANSQIVDSTLLGNGTYTFVYNTTGGANWTSDMATRTLYVNKGSTSFYLYLNGTEGNWTDGYSYDINNIANFTTSLNLSNQLVYLYSDYPGWVIQNSTNSLIFNLTSLTVNGGPYNLTAYWNGNDNYSSSTKTYFFGVKPYCINSTVSPSSGQTYSSSSTYNFSTTCIGNIKNVSLIWNNNNYQTFNISNLFYYNFTGLAAGSYSYYWNATDMNNHVFISPTYTYTINPIPVNLYWILPDTSSSWSAITGTTATITCQSNPSLNLTLGVGTSLSYSSTLGTVSTTASSSTATSFSFFCRPTDIVNYSGYISGTLTFSSSSTTTTSSSSSGSSTPTGSFLIKDLASSLAILQGESKSAQFTLSNTLSNNIANVSISVSGINSSWYTLSKSSISILAHGSSQAMTITFNIPNDAEAKNYDVTISAKGKALGETTPRIATKTMALTVNSSQPQPIQPLPSETVSPQPQPETSQDNNTANITSNQTVSGATGLAATFEFFKNNLVIILAIAACLLIFIFRNNLTTALTGTLGKEEAETHKAKAESPLKGIKDKFDYKLIVNLKKESKAKSLKEPTEVQGAEKVPEMIPEKQPKRPAVLEKEIKRDIKELQSIIENEKKVGKNKKKFNLGNN